ncbi:cysteine protease ATG4D isoform X2 [Cephus cinctus]|uniref:Cysteine protease n=1 Tax=Cephus cinctus TaxID=211228 RepID=A0AAJ7C6W1_CEPCN|nr:cysteine protease ATG4D isoform X2 [Cephus cinctus]
MNGQVQPSRERLGGYSSNSTNWFSSLVNSGHGNSMQTITPLAEGELPLDEAAIATEADGKVKTKLLSMWNNVKYGWTVKMKTNFSKEYPVWLLGSCYKKSTEGSDGLTESMKLDMKTGSEISLAMDATKFEEGIEGFKRDFTSRLWLTYRREFPILNGSTFTTDCGWGCMLRSGQMMMAQALVCHFLGRDWRWKPDCRIETDQQMVEDEKHRMIIKWFGDKPGPHSPLSIHTLVSLGAASGKRAGDWYGPASVAHLIRQAVRQAYSDYDEFENLAVYVAQDCAVYLDDVKVACEKSNGEWRSLVLLVPLRLGADKLNPSYAPCLTALLSLNECIGIIGGRPRHSLYFIGYQEDKLIHLDPHYCQETVDVWKPNFSLASFHCTSPRKMLVSKMDPSCCVGFYLHDKNAFEEFAKTVVPFLVPPNQKVEYPMFLFCEGSGDDLHQGVEVSEGSIPASISSEALDILEDNTHYECEEFEIL